MNAREPWSEPPEPYEPRRARPRVRVMIKGGRIVWSDEVVFPRRAQLDADKRIVWCD